MKAVLLKFLSTVNRYGMIEEGDRVLVAVSGGPDSVFLLHLLVRFRRKLGIEEIIVSHVNYGKRGIDADLDQEFVEKLSRYLGLDVHVKTVSPAYLKKVKRENFQRVARDIRYRFFHKVAKKCGAGRIAVAHTLSDQSETVFMRFIAGQGLKGLKGIPPVTEDGLIRPLIEISREEIEDFLKSESLGYRIDTSNLEGLYERNRIRNEVFPLLSKATGRDVERKIWDSGEIFRQVEDIVEEATTSALRETFSPGKKTLDVKKYGGYAEIVRKSMLQKIGYGYLGTELNRRVLEKADSLIVRDIPSFSLNLPGGFVLERSYETAQFIEKYATAEKPIDLTIGRPGKYPIGEGREKLTASIHALSGMKSILARIIRDRNVAAFNAISDLFPIKVRNFHEGDRIIPFGMKRSKKLKKVFIERKIPREMRKRLPVLTIKDDIVWIPGVIRSAHHPLGSNTKKIIVLEYKRN
jgi:tRNA(Ile)-lysidine synthase